VPTAAYLIHGDDHGRIAERRAKLRAGAEAKAGSAGVEVYEGDACTPENLIAALSTMTFALGRRFVIADGVERWRDADAEHVAKALQTADPETITVALFAREDGRAKVSPKLIEAVERVGGKVEAERNPKPWEWPKWVAGEARALGLELESGAAGTLVAQVGERRQRLLRELEKLALEHGPNTTLSAEQINESCATSAERKVWDLADALVAGDRSSSLRLLLELRQQGERVTGLNYNIVRRLRDAIKVAEALAAGQSAAQVKKTLRMPPKAADRFVKDVASRDAEALRRALTAMADLEMESRVGAGGVLTEDTVAVRAVLTAAT
jgi:DNA polymerase-3 subunit delta